jgi:integrase
MGKPVGLTVKEIISLPPRAAPYETKDDAVTGGYVVKWPTGTLSYVLRYRYRNKKTKLTIGRFDPEARGGLAGARAKALKALSDLAEARKPDSVVLLDPAAEKRAARTTKVKAVRQAERAAARVSLQAVEAVVATFVMRYCKTKLRTWRTIERVLNREVVSRWKGRGLGEIGKADVHELLDSLVDRGAPIQANRVLAYLNKLCRWAMSRGIIERNPCDGLDRPAQEKSRDRVLDDRELGLIWRAAESVGWPFSPIMKLLILTGQRKSEICEGRWDEIDLAAKVWSLPPERVKNKRAHSIPLSTQAAEILVSLPRIGASDIMFTTTGETPVSGFSRAKRNLDAAIAALNGGEPLSDWTFHDIRRSVASGLARLGVALHVVEKILNHQSGSFAGIVGVYQRHSFAEEMCAALTRWANHIERVVTGSGEVKVIKLKGNRI